VKGIDKGMKRQWDGRGGGEAEDDKAGERSNCRAAGEGLSRYSKDITVSGKRRLGGYRAG